MDDINGIIYSPAARFFFRVSKIGTAMEYRRESPPSGIPYALPSGKRLQFANWKMAIEIVDLPIENGDFP